MNINQLISSYLINCYLYYELGESLISDSEFDKITVDLKENWNEVLNSNHPHKDLLNYEAIVGSTGFNLKGKYPTIVKNCAIEMIYKKEENEFKEIVKLVEKVYDQIKPKSINDLF